MTLDARALTRAVESHAASLGVFESVNRHEPKNAPGGTLTCSAWPARIRGDVRFSGLASTSGLVVFNVRIQKSMLAEPQDDIDDEMLDALDRLFDAYAGDFTLDGRIRQVDLRGASGSALEAEAGYVEQDGRMYRAYLITLPLVVNDVWSESP